MGEPVPGLTRPPGPAPRVSRRRSRRRRFRIGLLPSADAAIGEAERAVDLWPTPGRPRGIVGDGLSGQDPTALDIAAVEAEPRCRHVRQFRLGYAELVVFALHQQVTPADSELAAVDTRSVRGKRAGGDQLVEVDAQLRLVAERDCGAAYSRCAIALMSGWNTV